MKLHRLNSAQAGLRRGLKADHQIYLPLFKLVYQYGVSRKEIAERLGLFTDQITPRLQGRYPLREEEKIRIDEMVEDAGMGRMKSRPEFRRRARFRARPTRDFWERDVRGRGNLDIQIASELGYLIQHPSLVVLEGVLSISEEKWWLQTVSGAWIMVDWLNGSSAKAPLGSKSVVVAGNLESCGAGAIAMIGKAVVVDAQNSDMLLMRAFISRMMKPMVRFQRNSRNACKSLSVSQLRGRREHLYRLSRLWLTRLGATIFSTSWLYFAGDQERRLDGRRIPLTTGSFRYAGIDPYGIEKRTVAADRNDDEPGEDQGKAVEPTYGGRVFQRAQVPTKSIERDQARVPPGR